MTVTAMPVLAVLAIGLVTIPAFAETVSPYKQFQNGVPLEQIRCIGPKILMETGREMPACVNHDTAQKMQQRGWKVLEMPYPDALESPANTELGNAETYTSAKMISAGSMDKYMASSAGFSSIFPLYNLTFPEQVRVGERFEVVLDYTFAIPSVEKDEQTGVEFLNYEDPEEACSVACMEYLKQVGSGFFMVRNTYVDLENKEAYELLGIVNNTYHIPVREFEHRFMAPAYDNTQPHQETFAFTINETGTEFPLGEIQIDFNSKGHGIIYFYVKPDNTIRLSDEPIIVEGFMLVENHHSDLPPPNSTARSTSEEPYDLIPESAWEDFAEYLRMIEGEVDSYYGFLQGHIETGAVNEEWIDSFFESYPEFDDRLKSQSFTPPLSFLLPSAHAQIPPTSFVYGYAYYYDLDNAKTVLKNTKICAYTKIYQDYGPVMNGQTHICDETDMSGFFSLVGVPQGTNLYLGSHAEGDDVKVVKNKKMLQMNGT